MTKIQFSKEEKTQITTRIQMYFHEELDQGIGNFDAEFLLDFFSEEMGAYFYNLGIYDSQHLMNKKVEEIEYLVQELERPTEFRK